MMKIRVALDWVLTSSRGESFLEVEDRDPYESLSLLLLVVIFAARKPNISLLRNKTSR